MPLSSFKDHQKAETFQFPMKDFSVAKTGLLCALIIAVAAGLIIWWWGRAPQVETTHIASTMDVAFADQISFLPDGRFVAVREGSAVFLCQPQSQGLQARLIFEFTSFRHFIERKQKPAVASTGYEPGSQPASQLPSPGDLKTAVSPDASKIAVYSNGVLAVFPHDWSGKDEDVRFAYLDVKDKHVPTALAFIDDKVVVAYQDGQIEFRGSTTVESISKLVRELSSVAAPGVEIDSVPVDHPSTMKVFGDFLVVVSRETLKISIFRVRSGRITQLSTYGIPTSREEDFKLAMFYTGRLAFSIGTNDVYVTSANDSSNPIVRWPAYGTVYALSFLDNDHIAVGGNFQDVYLLAEGETPFNIATANPGVSALAVSSNRLAYSTNQLVLMSYAWRRVLNRIGWIALISGIGLIVLIGLGAQYLSKVPSVALTIPSVTVSEEKVPQLPIPEVPSALVKALRAGECVLYCGSGVSAQAGFPYWQSFVNDLTEWAILRGFVDTPFAASLKAALSQGEYGSVSDNLVSIMRNHQSQLNDYLRATFLKTTTLPNSLNLLKGLPFSGAMTTNFDSLLEQAFSDKATPALTPSDAERLLQCLHKREFFLLKLYGKLDQPDSVMLAPSQYDDVVKNNLLFASFMETLLISRTVFFLGSSLEGIQAYLKGMPLTRQGQRTHYALIKVTDEAWQAKANPLKERYGIEVLPYSASAGYPEVDKFIKSLTAQVNADSEDATERVEQGSVLKKMSLSDVGPFENLELNFDPHWNILLGDNGVGKSSVIKAIAISILGEDSKAYAQRIIKSGKPSSVITLETGRGIYTTRLFRKNGEARVESIPGRPFEAEGWLAIGFPPLRTVSWARPTTTETQTKGRPKTEDLLPVIVGEADPRLDKLKQWIVNVDYWIKDARSRKENPRQYERLLEDFFNVVSQLTTGAKIEFKEVKAQTNEITIITDDGELPIEALSQGVTSLIGWVGILLQRLYEVYGTDEGDPKQSYALVLMDEIDAHLHPAWQQSLIRKLGKIFPHVQFIATTHSPLIVGGMKPEQIIRFARDEDDKVVTYKIVEDMTIGRADQILASDLFGLQSTMALNEDLETLMAKYHELLAKNRNEAEETRFQQLREVLKSRIPGAGETPAEQKAMGLIRALLQPEGDGEYRSINENTLQLAEELLNEVAKKRK